MEKTTLPIAVEQPPPAPSAKQRVVRAFLFSLTILLCLNWLSAPLRDFYNDQLGKKHGSHASKNHCNQVDALWPSSENDKLKDAYDFLFSHQFENASIARLSGAVQIKTESFDDLGEIGEDKRWDVFYPFHKYLEATFPRIHNPYAPQYSTKNSPSDPTTPPSPPSSQIYTCPSPTPTSTSYPFSSSSLPHPFAPHVHFYSQTRTPPPLASPPSKPPTSSTESNSSNSHSTTTHSQNPPH